MTHFRSLAFASALALAGLAAPAATQDRAVSDEHEYYDSYRGGFDERSDADDWFYDFYEHEDLESDDTLAQVDLDMLEHDFEWEQEGLFN